MASHEPLPLWLLHLAVRLLLIGVGFSDYFFSPAVQSSSPAFVRLFDIIVGFLLLFGSGTRLVIVVNLGTYLAGLAVEPALVLVLEYVPGLPTIAFAGGGRPGADHVAASMAVDDRTLYPCIDLFYRRVALPFVERTRHFEAYVPAIPRIDLGLTFVCLSVVQKFMELSSALMVVAKYDLTAVVPVAPELRVVGAGLAKMLVGVLFVGGAFTRTASGVAFLLFTTTLFGLPGDPVLTHISLFGLVSALLTIGGRLLSVDCTLSSRSMDDAENDGDAFGRSVGT